MKRYKILKKASLGTSINSNNKNANPQWYRSNGTPNSFSEDPISVNKTLKPVNREDASLEAEKGETAFTDLAGDGIPQLYKIGGERHYKGGTPLDLPEDSFIFSRDKKMKIAGDILNSFGKPKGTKDKYTPAELSNQYQLNDFRKVLADKDSDKLQRDTAEVMIANYNLKLAKLGLVQESSKGFPDGIPAIAMPYIDMMNIDPSQFVAPQGQPEVPGGTMAQYGGNMKRQTGGEGWQSAAGKNDPSTGYWDRVAGANLFQRTGDDDVDPRMHQAFEKLYGKGATGFGDWLQNLFTMPEKEINNLLTGYYEGPGTTAKRYDPDTHAGVINLVADPMMYPELPYAIGKGAVKGVAKAAPYVASAATTAAKATAKYGKKAIDLVIKYVPNFNMGTLATIASRLGQAGLHLDDNTTPEDIQKALASTYSSEKEYKAHLLDPYSKEKVAAQTAWNLQAPPSYNTVSPPVSPVPSIQPITKPSSSDVYGISDTTRNISDEEQKKLLGLKYGGDLSKAKLGVSVSGGKYYYEDDKGKVTEISKGNYDAYTAKHTPTTPAKGTGLKTPTQTTIGKFNPYGNESIRKSLENPESSYYQKDVAGKQAANPSGGYGTQDFTGFQNNNKEILAKFKEKFGRDYDKNSDAEWYQGEYNNQLIEDAKAAGYTDPKELALFVNTLGFNKDVVKGSGDPRGTDAQHGDWTNSRIRFKFKPKDAIIAPGSKEEVTTKSIEQAIIPDAYKSPKADWWLQDKIKTAGAFSDLMRIKKYNPWQATPAVAYGERTFYDPTRELASNAEQVNMGIQGAQTFSGPQSFAATAAYLQGQGSKNAADIMGRYNNMNVQASNQLSDMNTGIFNQAAQQRAASATQLFDKQTIANQQFDNSKNLARQNLRQGFIDAVTNRANTYNLNTLYPQYAIDPNTGGMAYNPAGSNRMPTKNEPASDVGAQIKAIQDRNDISEANKALWIKSLFGKSQSDQTTV